MLDLLIIVNAFCKLAAVNNVDYDTIYKERIENLSKENPYPFSSWFGPDGRTYEPFNEESEDVDSEVEDLLTEHGYTITNYRKGYASKNGRELRIGKIFNLIKKDLIKKLNEKTEKENLQSEYGTSLNEINKYIQDVEDTFQRSTFRTGANKELFIVYSQNPHDVAKMSTNRNWNSCMELGSGTYHKSIFCDVAQGGFVAYLIVKDDNDVNKPIARIHIRRFINAKGESFALPEKEVYGDNIAGFKDAVQKWVDSHQGTISTGIYHMLGGDYSDTYANSTAVTGDSEEELTDILEKKILEPAIPATVYIVEDRLYNCIHELLENHQDEWGKDFQFPIDNRKRKFVNKTDAEAYIENAKHSPIIRNENVRVRNSYVYQTGYDEDREEYERENRDESEDENYDYYSENREELQEIEQCSFERFKLTSHITENINMEIRQEAVSTIVNAKKGTYSQNLIDLAADYLFGSSQIYLNDKSRAFLRKYPEFASIELINKTQRFNDKNEILSFLPNDKQQEYLKTIIPVIENIKNLNDLEDLGAYYVVNMLWKFNTIPDVIVNKLATILINYDFSKDSMYIAKEILRLFIEKNVSNTALIMLYGDFIVYWKDLGPELGLLIAQLGHNAKGFLSFINEKLENKQAERDRVMLPNGWYSTSLQKDIENLEFIKDSIENGFNNSKVSPKVSPNGYEYHIWL